MDKSTIVIGIDHGWANMKTISYLFTSGMKEITTEPALYEDVLEWEGKFYKIGGKRLTVSPPGTRIGESCFTQPLIVLRFTPYSRSSCGYEVPPELYRSTICCLNSGV